MMTPPRGLAFLRHGYFATYHEMFRSSVSETLRTSWRDVYECATLFQ